MNCLGSISWGGGGARCFDGYVSFLLLVIGHRRQSAYRQRLSLRYIRLGSPGMVSRSCLLSCVTHHSVSVWQTRLLILYIVKSKEREERVPLALTEDPSNDLETCCWTLPQFLQLPNVTSPRIKSPHTQACGRYWRVSYSHGSRLLSF